MNTLQEIDFWETRRSHYIDKYVEHCDNPVARAIYRTRLESIKKTIDALMEKRAEEKRRRQENWIVRWWHSWTDVARV